MIKLALFHSNKFRVTVDDIELHNLISMEKLEILKIEMDWISTVQSNLRICFPWTLKKLSLSGVGLPWEAMKIVASLPKLQVLKLRKHACIGKTWETSEGGFSHLAFLLIETSYLEKWVTKSSHFPKLKNLLLHECPYLRGLQYSVGDMRTLEVIEVDQNQFLGSSAKQIQKDRQCLGDDGLQIRIV